MACRRWPAGDPPTGPRHRWKPRCRTSRAGTGVPWRWRPGSRGSGVPCCWRPGGWGSGVPWHWRPGCLLVVPHCLVAPKRRQHHRLDHHACDPPAGTLCIGCCLDMQRRDGLSPSTWSTLSAVGQPSAVPCDTGARWIPRSLLSFPKAFQGCWRTQTAGQSGILSISRPYFWSFRLSERISTQTLVLLMLSMSFPSTEIGMSETHTFVTGTSSPLPPLTMKGLLSYTCTVFCLRVRLSISNLFLAVLVRG